jgi:DNA polymerase I-like protein with 3'-5' exonuclease and polymerase domains
MPLNEMRNYPLQAGGADLYNLVIVQITEEVPGARFVYGLHDSLWFSVPYHRISDYLPRIKQIAEQPRQINGRMIPFPASFKMMDDQGVVTKL